jgi:hypothetical protein
MDKNTLTSKLLPEHLEKFDPAELEEVILTAAKVLWAENQIMDALTALARDYPGPIRFAEIKATLAMWIITKNNSFKGINSDIPDPKARNLIGALCSFDLHSARNGARIDRQPIKA